MTNRTSAGRFDRNVAQATDAPIEFTLNGTPVSVRARPPAPAGGAARGARRHLAQGRLLAVGPVRVLHGAGRRQGRRQLQPRAGQGRRQGRRHARGRRRRRAPALRRRVRRVRRPAVRVLHPRHRRCGPSRRSTRRAPTSTARRWPRTSAPTCAAAPATSRSSTPSRPWPRARRSSRRSAAAIGASGAKYEAGELALGDRGYVDDIRVPGMLHAALHLTAHARADVDGDRHVGGGRRATGSSACSRRPTSRASCASGSSTRTGRS